jgi:hypothetical protein
MKGFVPMREESKQFFFEKKNQKTFFLRPGDVETSG